MHKKSLDCECHSTSGEELAAFEVVVLQMLEDVQERLVYRAQVILVRAMKVCTSTVEDQQYNIDDMTWHMV